MQTISLNCLQLQMKTPLNLKPRCIFSTSEVWPIGNSLRIRALFRRKEPITDTDFKKCLLCSPNNNHFHLISAVTESFSLHLKMESSEVSLSHSSSLHRQTEVAKGRLDTKRSTADGSFPSPHSLCSQGFLLQTVVLAVPCAVEVLCSLAPEH